MPLSCPLCSHPYTFKPLTHRTLSEFLTLISPASLLTLSLVIFPDFPCSFKFILPSLSLISLSTSLPTTRHLPSGSVAGALPTLCLPPVQLFTSWHRVLFLTNILITVRLDLRLGHNVIYWNIVCFCGVNSQAATENVLYESGMGQNDSLRIMLFNGALMARSRKHGSQFDTAGCDSCHTVTL